MKIISSILHWFVLESRGSKMSKTILRVLSIFHFQQLFDNFSSNLLEDGCPQGFLPILLFLTIYWSFLFKFALIYAQGWMSAKGSFWTRCIEVHSQVDSPSLWFRTDNFENKRIRLSGAAKIVTRHDWGLWGVAGGLVEFGGQRHVNAWSRCLYIKEGKLSGFERRGGKW